MGWSFWPFGKKKEEEPPEQLVLGAELKCPYGSAHSFLMVEAERIDVTNLPNACVTDSKPFKDEAPYGNIMPFGECTLRVPCKEIMDLEEQWENPEPQAMLANGKEVITTKSTLICKKSGMEIQAVNSGQDGEVARQWAEMSELIHETNAKYPGLIDILKNPNVSLYLNEGMYQNAIRFLEDCIEKHDGKIDLAVVYAPKDLESNLIRLALGRLLPGCDETKPEGYLTVLEERGVATEMYKNPDWDAHVLNKEMIEMLWKDCADTAERIDTNAIHRFPEEHKWGTRLVGESIMGFGYGCVLYYAAIERQRQSRRQQDAEAKEKTSNEEVKVSNKTNEVASDAGEKSNDVKSECSDNSIDVELKYKDEWTPNQRAEADAKLQTLSEAKTVKTPVNRGGTSASSRYKSAYGDACVPEGYDVDHTIDLQLGGKDDILNMKPLDSSFNRSLGVQIKNAIKNYPDGTEFGEFTIH